MKKAAVILFPKALASAVAIPLDMLAAANDIARVWRHPEGTIDITTLYCESNPVKLSNGLKVHCDSKLLAQSDFDLILIPGMWGNMRQVIGRHPEVIDWIAKQGRTDAILCSIVTGSHLLAATGLLDGKSATTHWHFFDQFQNDFPQVKLQRKRFITREENLCCTGSVNAARDIMLYIIQRMFNARIANQVARHFTHEIKRGYESMMLDSDQRSSHHDETIIKVQEWLQQHYADTIQIKNLADKFGLSARTLNRRFHLATNTTPLQYLQELRIEHAQELLKASNLGVSEIADKVGYADASYFSSLFKKINGVTPIEYRKLVRNKLFLAEK